MTAYASAPFKNINFSYSWDIDTLTWVPTTPGIASGGAGDASAANQATQITRAETGNASLASIDTKLSGPVSVSVGNIPHVVVDTAPTTAVTGAFFQATQPVSLATAPTTPVTGTFWQATQPVSGTVTASGPLTDTQLRASTVPVAATLTAETTKVIGTVNQGTSPWVTGALTDTQLRAVAVPVSGTVTANAGSGTLAVSGPVTDTQIRATPLPVSGTVTANAGSGTLAVSGPVTDTQIRATPLPISGTVTANAGSGTLAVSNTNLDVALSTRLKPADTLTAVTTVGTITNVVHVDDNAASLTVDGTVAATQSGTWTMQPGNTANTTAWKVDASSVAVPITDNAGSLTIDNPILSLVGGGTESGVQRVTIATDSTGVLSIDDNAGSLTVDGTVALSAGSAVIGHVINDTGSTTAVTGNVTAIQGTGTNLHTVVDSGTITTVSTVTAVTAISNALPAGNNNIGDVDVVTLPALVAGTALIGKVGIDQTTPGTTNRVDIGVFPDNEPFNVSQFGGSAVVTGAGAGGAGIPRVTVSNDSSLAANQSVNMNQVGGSAVALRTVPTNGSGASSMPVDSNVIQYATYTALANRVASGALTANTAKQVLSLEHGGAATKTVEIRQISISGYATTTVAGTVEFYLTRGTAASSGGTSVTPAPMNPATTAAEVTVKTLPTIVAATFVLAGAATAVPATANSTIGSSFLFYDWKADGQQQPLTLRAGNLDSLVLSIESTAIINVTMMITVILTEK